MMKIVQRLWSAAERPCGECGGQRVIIDPAVIAFTQKHGRDIGAATVDCEMTMGHQQTSLGTAGCKTETVDNIIQA